MSAIEYVVPVGCAAIVSSTKHSPQQDSAAADSGNGATKEEELVDPISPTKRSQPESVATDSGNGATKEEELVDPVSPRPLSPNTWRNARNRRIEMQEKQALANIKRYGIVSIVNGLLSG
jgi:hypothetical protein